MLNKIFYIVICLSLVVPLVARAEDISSVKKEATDPPVNQDKERHFYDKSDKPGWWWGHYKPDEKEPKKEEKDRKAPAIPPSLGTFSQERLWNMHPDAFQALLMDYQKKAVMSPTEDNVRDYYVMQDIARRKSAAFTNVAMMVWQKNPDLFVLKDYPSSPLGIASRVRQQNNDIEAKIRNNIDNFALVYFYSPTCDYCAEQTNILKFFVDKYGWIIKRVDITANHNLAARFNIETVPTIIMVYRNTEDYMPVTAGIATLNVIEENLYRGIRLMTGEITPDQYSLYDFQNNSSFDPYATKNGKDNAEIGNRGQGGD